MSGISQISRYMEAALSRAGAEPSTYNSDLTAVVAFQDALQDVFDNTRGDVFVEYAVVQLRNESGYPVGHIVYDAKGDASRFIAHADGESRKES